MHRVGVFEACGYALAFMISVQSYRYPESQAQAAMMVGITGGLAFMPLWGYSTFLHTTGTTIHIAYTLQ